jgi:hypothetical protein
MRGVLGIESSRAKVIYFSANHFSTLLSSLLPEGQEYVHCSIAFTMSIIFCSAPLEYALNIGTSNNSSKSDR